MPIDTDGPHRVDDRDEHTFWLEHTTIGLQSVAAPSILGLFGFAVSTFMVAANLAGWFGNETTTPLVLFAFGFWFIGLAAVTWTGFVAALAENTAISLVLLTLAAGSTLLAIGLTVTIAWLVTIGAIVLVASAVLAWYTASAMVLEASTGRGVLPIGKRAGDRDSGASTRGPIEYAAGHPGVKIGQ